MTMFISKMFSEKRRYRQYKARIKALPDAYKAAADAIERYLMYAGSITRGDIILSMLDDLADLFEQSALNRTPIRDIVGEDPVEFAEAFLENYAEGKWIAKERARLADAIDHVARDAT